MVGDFVNSKIEIRNGNIGRGVFASKDILIGELLFV
jgi:hypothetical protein